MERRKFIQNSGLLAAGLYHSPLKAIAGPFAPSPLLHNIPVDKKLDPQWVKSLYQRGFVTTYKKTKNELQYIGMPIGGIFTGTVYVGGDGRLWLWDIFNENQNGIDPKTIEWGMDLHVGKKVRPQDGSAYVQPAKDIRPIEQGFAFKIIAGKKTVIKKLEASDWDEILFEATYPMAKVHYIDHSLGLDITASIFSPFIPLDEKNSGLPCTIYSFSVKNKTTKDMQVKSIHRFAKISAFKAREVTRAIQGLPATDALDLLRFTPKKAAGLILKTLRSAIANAENNNSLNVSDLVVKEAVVGEGPTLNRSQPKARGSAGPIRKRSSHIRVVLTDEIEIVRREDKLKKKKPKTTKKASAKSKAPAAEPAPATETESAAPAAETKE